MLKPFLTAHWRYLAMLNFAIDPQLLAPSVPVGTELDFFAGESYVSVVGFLFYHTVARGLPVPRHRNFEEVNLRFYVRKKSGDTCRRGVVFIRELVPKVAIAVTARVFYGEPYLALPMRSEVEDKDGLVKAKYEWRRGKKMGTPNDDGKRLRAADRRGLARRIHHRTLLGLYRSRRRDEGISHRTSALETLAIG